MAGSERIDLEVLIARRKVELSTQASKLAVEKVAVTTAASNEALRIKAKARPIRQLAMQTADYLRARGIKPVGIPGPKEIRPKGVFRKAQRETVYVYPFRYEAGQMYSEPFSGQYSRGHYYEGISTFAFDWNGTFYSVNGAKDSPNVYMLSDEALLGNPNHYINGALPPNRPELPDEQLHALWERAFADLIIKRL